MLLKIWHFCRDSVMGKVEILQALDVWKVETLLLQNHNFCTFKIFSHNRHIPHLSAEKKVFENSINAIEDIAFLQGQCNGKNWNFTCSGSWKSWERCYCKIKMSIHFKLSTTIATLLILEIKKCLWKFDKCFWRYSISAGTV